MPSAIAMTVEAAARPVPVSSGAIHRSEPGRTLRGAECGDKADLRHRPGGHERQIGPGGQCVDSNSWPDVRRFHHKGTKTRRSISALRDKVFFASRGLLGVNLPGVLTPPPIGRRGVGDRSVLKLGAVTSRSPERDGDVASPTRARDWLRTTHGNNASHPNEKARTKVRASFRQESDVLPAAGAAGAAGGAGGAARLRVRDGRAGHAGRRHRRDDGEEDGAKQDTRGVHLRLI